MRRHHKPSDLSSSYPTGFNRSPFTIREVRCCTWWPANKIPSVIPLAVIVCFLTCLVWSFRRLPEDHDEYPDGFTCPDSTHKILDYRNVTISCKPCLECPLRQQLLPPCGSTTKSETSIECRNCPPDTDKESKGADKSKPCQTCGLRETFSQHTPEKNALCGDCPRGKYQENYTLESCKRCSTCCGVKRFAELKCIYLKQCVRKNCTKQLKIKESSVLRSEDSMRVIKLFAIESTAHETAVTQRSASQSDNPEPTRDWVLVDTVRSQLKESKIKRETNTKMFSADVVRPIFVFSMGSKLFTAESTAHETVVTQQSASQSDNPEPTRDLVLQGEVGEVNEKMLGTSFGKSASQRVEKATAYFLEGYNSNPATPVFSEVGKAAFEMAMRVLKESKSTKREANAKMSSADVVRPTIPSSKDFKLFTTESTAHERAVTRRSASQSYNPGATRDGVLVDKVWSQLKQSKIKREVNVKILGTRIDKSASQRVEKATAYVQISPSNLATPASAEGNGVASLSTPQSKLHKSFGTAFDTSVEEPPMQSAISSDSGNDSKLLTILIVLVGIAIVLILSAIIMAWKNQSGHFSGRSCTVTCCAKHIYFRDVNEYRSLMPDTFQSDSEIAYTSDNGVATSSENTEINYDIENFALCELPPTLENILIKKLDVLHKGEYGWKKLGEAFEIDNDDLTYLETAYKRSVGSPTKELLEILDKNQRRTVGEVLSTLTGSYVNRPDVARLIYQKWQEI